MRVYGHLVAAQVRSQLQYRTSFTLDLIGQTLFTVLDYVTVIVLFSVTPTLAGFTLPQVLLITSIAAVGFGLADLAVGNVERLKAYIRTGTLDAMLIRPRRVLPQLLAIDFQPRRLGRLAFALGGLVVASVACELDWTVWTVVKLVAAPIVAGVYFSALFVAAASVAFWWIDSGEFANSLTYGGREFTTYPINLYGGLFRHVFAFALGFGFVSYYPALSITGIPDPLGMPTWIAALSPIVAALAAALAAVCWHLGIRHYNGTGS